MSTAQNTAQDMGLDLDTVDLLVLSEVADLDGFDDVGEWLTWAVFNYAFWVCNGELEWRLQDEVVEAMNARWGVVKGAA